MQKKILLLTIIFTLLLLTACSNTVQTTPETKELEIIPIKTITETGSFTQEECSARALENKVIMIESRYCGHCQETKPDFLAACTSNQISPELIDLAEKEGRDKVASYSIEVQYTPTFIIGCNYYVGKMSKTKYNELLRG